MEPKEILDFHRMFFGDLHYGFLLEVVVRTIIMYLYTILLLRFLGKRSMGQLSTLELAIIISFGSAVGDPMLNVEVPILHGMVVITTIAFLQIGLEYLINQNKNLEALMAVTLTAAPLVLTRIFFAKASILNHVPIVGKKDGYEQLYQKKEKSPPNAAFTNRKKVVQCLIKLFQCRV